jgi:RNA polymerase sigma-70 factor, ECF subfamily
MLLWFRGRRLLTPSSYYIRNTTENRWLLSSPSLRNLSEGASRTPERRENCLSSAELKGGSADVALLSAIRSGDERAMAQLYDRYSSVVYAVALRVLADTAAA